MAKSMEIKIKKIRPEINFDLKYQTDGASGLDCYSMVTEWIEPGGRTKIPLGFAIEIPDGYEGQIRPRSGLSFKEGLVVVQGTIDSDYRGEVCAIIINHDYHEKKIQTGDRICQLIISPILRVELEVVEDLNQTKRAWGGFGSTGGC